MFLSFLLCWSPFLIIGPLCLLEHYALRALRTRMGYEGFGYTMASLVVYLGPFVLLVMAGALLSWLMVDGAWVWLGESAPIGPRPEWGANLFILFMATWPFWVGYLGVGFAVWVLGLQDVLRNRDSGGEAAGDFQLDPGRG
jgi:hypothetical protein